MFNHACPGHPSQLEHGVLSGSLGSCILRSHDAVGSHTQLQPYAHMHMCAPLLYQAVCYASLGTWQRQLDAGVSGVRCLRPGHACCSGGGGESRQGRQGIRTRGLRDGDSLSPTRGARVFIEILVLLAVTSVFVVTGMSSGVLALLACKRAGLFLLAATCFSRASFESITRCLYEGASGYPVATSLVRLLSAGC